MQLIHQMGPVKQQNQANPVVCTQQFLVIEHKLTGHSLQTIPTFYTAIIYKCCSYCVHITHFVNNSGIRGHSIPVRDTWDNIQMANGVVVIKILKTPFFVNIICPVDFTLIANSVCCGKYTLPIYVFLVQRYM